jgi:hypothetical protein
MNRQAFIADFRAARLAAKFKPTPAPTMAARACVAARKAKSPVPFILRWDQQARAAGTVYLRPQAFALALIYRRAK